MDTAPIEDLIDQYHATYTKIRQGIEGLTEDELRFKPEPDKWSIKEIVVHLCDSEINAVQRMRKVIAEENPFLTAFDQDQWVKRLDYQNLDANLGLVTFGVLRESTVALLRKQPPEAWARKGNHEEDGTITSSIS